MILRQLRWVTASLLAAAALLAAPARSDAATTIMIQQVQLDASGAVVGTIGASAAYTTPTMFGQFALNSISPNLVSGVSGFPTGPSRFFSLTTTVNVSPTSAAFDPSIGLQVVVTVDGLQPLFDNQPGRLNNNAGASSGLESGNNLISNQSQLLDGAAGNLGAASTTAVDARPGPAPVGTASTSPAVAIMSIPGLFGIQQTILVRAEAGATGVVGTLGGTASTTVGIDTPAAVPAPAGLVLALAAVPVLGLRRVLRRKTAV